jgi:hypothetical protein
MQRETWISSTNARHVVKLRATAEGTAKRLCNYLIMYCSGSCLLYLSFTFPLFTHIRTGLLRFYCASKAPLPHSALI